MLHILRYNDTYCNCYDSTVPERGQYNILDSTICGLVDRGCSFIQDHNTTLPHDGTSQAEQLGKVEGISQHKDRICYIQILHKTFKAQSTKLIDVCN